MQLLNKGALSLLASSARDPVNGNNSPPKRVEVPKYDPADLSAGILHVGVGNFFRAHFASYLDELFNHEPEEEAHQAWGVVGCGVTNGSYSKRKEDLESQDMLYTLVENDGDGSSARVVGSLIDLLPYDSKFGPIKEKLMDPDIKIVSTCITEGGYYLCPAAGTLDLEHPDIQHDLKNPDDPQTVIGLVVQALRKRKETGQDPFTLLCLDNIPQNGGVFSEVVCSLAKLQDRELGEWIEKNVCFPNSMVDRITPATGKKELEYLKEKYGCEDKQAVFCEPFTQWVVEDNFVGGVRPALEKVGVQFVEDVEPYELAKLRVLNGGHASLCYPACLLGIEYVHEAMDHPVIGPFLDCLERTELVPGLEPLPDTTIEAYWETIKKRFENPTIFDRIDRNCENGSDRQPKFIIPAIHAAIKDGNLPLDGLALVSAMWCRFCQGTTENGEKVPASDTKWDKLNSVALKAKENPKEWLTLKEIYGIARDDERFSNAFEAALNKINQDGVEAAMKEYIKKNGLTPEKENSRTFAMS